MNVSEALSKTLALNLLSKETLEIIRKVTSNKPTPTLRPSLSYSFSNKRINSDKPTPCLESKLAEIRNGSSFVSQLNHSNNPNSYRLTDNQPPKSPFNMYEFFQPAELSEMYTPMKSRNNATYEEKEEVKSEDEQMEEEVEEEEA